MKAFLVLKVRKSVLEELAFTKSDFLDLVTFGFLADFVVVDRYSKLLPTLPPPALAISLGTS